MLPTVRQLEFFAATADTGQISRAAALLNVTQSSVTIAIGRLEAQLGYKLFIRRSHGMELTANGETFLRHVHAILGALREAVDTRTRTASNMAGTVRLAVTDTVSGYFLPAAWERLAERHPGITLSVTETSRAQIERGLIEGRFDLGLALTSNLPEPERYEIVPVLSSPRSLWLAASHRLARQNHIGFADLRDENYILLTMDEHETTMRQIWTEYGFEPKILFRSHSMEALRSMVARGMGITVLSDMVYRSWSLEGQRIIRKRLGDAVPNMDTGLFWPRQRDLDAASLATLRSLSARP
ncbi:MAG: LysR family transcriptional regulator [Rhodobacteraceae bacterium]|nr:LysR family transcriptional regulator [Paracoccaceae bacterium]